MSVFAFVCVCVHINDKCFGVFFARMFLFVAVAFGYLFNQIYDFRFENKRSKALNLVFVRILTTTDSSYKSATQISPRVCSNRKNAVIANYTVSPELN